MRILISLKVIHKNIEYLFKFNEVIKGNKLVTKKAQKLGSHSFAVSSIFEQFRPVNPQVLYHESDFQGSH